MQPTMLLEISNYIRDSLDKKFLDFPEEIRHVFSDAILAGNTIASLMHGEEPNDWDVLLSEDKIVEFSKFLRNTNDPNLGLPYFGYFPHFPNGIQICLLLLTKQTRHVDFIHTLAYYDVEKSELVLTEEQLYCIKNKVLRHNVDGHELKRDRILKYFERGWSTDDPSILEFMRG